MRVHVVPVTWSERHAVLEDIRRRVFIDEQGVPAEVERDGRDAEARHFLAVDEAGQYVGCGRLLPSGQIGRLAVLPERRGSGVGARLLALAVAEAREQGQTLVFLNAQVQAEEFYRRAGFVPVGEPFMEAGLPHQRMELKLPIPFQASGAVAAPVVREEAPHPDADSGAVVSRRGERACRDGVVDVAGHATREICIYSQLLDHALFDDEAVVDALSAFVRSGPPARLRVLIQSSSVIVSRGHRLVELARRLPSKVEVRLVPGELADDQRCYVTADERALLLLPDASVYQGFSNGYDPVEATRLVEGFNYLWERSHPDPELRTLSL